MENQYPSNSDRGQEPQKRVSAPVVSGTVSAQKKTAWNAVEEFFGLGECRSFRDYVGALSDMTNRVYGAIDTLLGNRKYNGTTVPAARVQYQYPPYASYYNAPAQQAPQQPQPQQPSLSGYGQYYITYDLEADAHVVLAGMIDLLRTFNNVSINDMFDLAGVTSPVGYNDCKFGWRNLDGVRVIPFGSKFVINLPPAMPL